MKVGRYKIRLNPAVGAWFREHSNDLAMAVLMLVIIPITVGPVAIYLYGGTIATGVFVTDSTTTFGWLGVWLFGAVAEIAAIFSYWIGRALIQIEKEASA